MSCRLLVEFGSAKSTKLASGLKPSVTLSPDGGAATGEAVGRRNVADRAMQANGVVVFDPAGHERPHIIGKLLGA